MDADQESQEVAEHLDGTVQTLRSEGRYPAHIEEARRLLREALTPDSRISVPARREAVPLLEQGITDLTHDERWADASGVAVDLSETLLTLKEPEGARRAADLGIYLAERAVEILDAAAATVKHDLELRYDHLEVETPLEMLHGKHREQAAGLNTLTAVALDRYVKSFTEPPERGADYHRLRDNLDKLHDLDPVRRGDLAKTLRSIGEAAALLEPGSSRRDGRHLRRMATFYRDMAESAQFDDSPPEYSRRMELRPQSGHVPTSWRTESVRLRRNFDVITPHNYPHNYYKPYEWQGLITAKQKEYARSSSIAN